MPNPENIRPYIRKPGDPGLPGAGHPKGMSNKKPPLPPINVNALPFPLVKLNQRMSIETYWDKQAPKVLEYMLNRLDRHFVYEEQGHPDPLGNKIFKVLAPEIAKELGRRAKRKAKDDEDNTIGHNIEGHDVKVFRQKILNLKKSLSDPKPLKPDVEEAHYKPAPPTTELPSVGKLPSDF